MNRPHRATIVLGGLISALFASKAFASDEPLDTLGHLGPWAIPLSAALIAWSKDDGDGLVELAEGAVYTAATTYALKYVAEAHSGDGDTYSYPSTQTAMAAQGAAFLQFRYGWRYGIPAYGLAALVGYTQVKHYDQDWRGVAAGIFIATGIQYAVSDLGYSAKDYVLVPYFTGKEAGLIARVRF
jgi:hypothetical protein